MLGAVCIVCAAPPLLGNAIGVDSGFHLNLNLPAFPLITRTQLGGACCVFSNFSVVQLVMAPALKTAAHNARHSVQPGDRSFPKQQTLHYMVGYQHEAGKEPVLCAEEPEEATGDLIKAARPAPAAPAAAAASARSALPQWVAQDRKVLRFFGYSQQHVTENPLENTRLRRVVFLYYLEDDTMQISEPKQDNSGLPQVRFCIVF